MSIKPAWVLLVLAAANASAAAMSDAEKEDFLRTAKVIRTEEISVGITRPLRATLEKNGLVHDAHIQRVDEFKPVERLATGIQIHFRDFWGFNIAAYKLDRLLGLDMVPVSVKRHYRGDEAAFTWWVDDVLMMEKDRWQKGIEPPDRDRWNRQMWRVRVFNELTHNTDPNLGNVLITKDWTIRLVDYTRAFRIQTNLRDENNLERIDRSLLSRLEGLDLETLKKELGGVLKDIEVEAIIKRRDRIVKFFRDKIAQLGEGAVLYDFP